MRMLIGTGVEGAVLLLLPSTPGPEVIKSGVNPGLIVKSGGGNHIRFHIEPDTIAPFLYVDGGEGENKDTRITGILHLIEQSDQRC